MPEKDGNLMMLVIGALSSGATLLVNYLIQRNKSTTEVEKARIQSLGLDKRTKELISQLEVSGKHLKQKDETISLMEKNLSTLKIEHGMYKTKFYTITGIVKELVSDKPEVVRIVERLEQRTN